MERQEYPTMLATLQPSQAVTVLNERTKHINKTNEDVANWLLERKKAEEAYSQALKRLAKKTPPDAGSDLGVFDSPWRNLLRATDAIADSHGNLARKLENDVERPLREFGASNRQMQQLSTVTGNLQSMAKDYDNSQRQTEKARGKAGNKIATASSQLENAASQWESQAPYVFENLQAADEGRWNHLRDVLTQLQTHEVDAAQRIREAAEKCLNALLNVETADEIKTFALRNTGQGGVVSSGRPRTQPSMERRASRDPDASTSSPAPPLINRASNGNTNDAASLRSVPVEEEKKSKLGGLRRLGTVMGRRRSMMPRDTPSKSKPGNLSAIPDDDPDRLQSSSGGYLDPVSTRDSDGPPRTFSGISDSLGRSGVERTVGGTSPSAPNTGATSDLSGLQAPLQPETTYEAPPGPPPGQLSSTSGPPATTDIQNGLDQSQGTNGADNGGYSIPASTLDPISQAQQEAAGSAESQPYKLDIRNAPIADENADAQAALSSVANSLRAQQAPPRRANTSRGRRDMRNSVFTPSLAEVEPTTEYRAPATSSPMTAPSTTSPNIASPSSFVPAALRQATGGHNIASDSQSIRSGHASLISTAAVVKHPDMHGPGLNASIVETVSAKFDDQGELFFNKFEGELALAYNSPHPTAAPTPSVSIRLENFLKIKDVKMKTFVSQPAADRFGEYAVGVSTLGPRPQVAFDYEVRVPTAMPAAYVPLKITPWWKRAGPHLNVRLKYSLQPGFQTSGAPITLRNVVLSVHLEGTEGVSSTQSRPNGTLQPESNTFSWKFNELTLTPEDKDVIVRFITGGSEVKVQKIEAGWEIMLAEESAIVESGLLGVSEAEGPGDPFADENVAAFKPLTSVRKLVRGTCEAEPRIWKDGQVSG